MEEVEEEGKVEESRSWISRKSEGEERSGRSRGCNRGERDKQNGGGEETAKMENLTK